MQTVVSEITFTFFDDALALATGAWRVTAGMANDTLIALLRKVVAPVDRLARSCDVAGVLAARDAAKRAVVTLVRSNPTSAPRGRRGVVGLCSIFRSLRDLT